MRRLMLLLCLVGLAAAAQDPQEQPAIAVTPQETVKPSETAAQETPPAQETDKPPAGTAQEQNPQEAKPQAAGPAASVPPPAATPQEEKPQATSPAATAAPQETTPQEVPPQATGPAPAATSSQETAGDGTTGQPADSGPSIPAGVGATLPDGANDSAAVPAGLAAAVPYPGANETGLPLVDYRIRVSLDADQYLLKGNEVMVFTNNSPDIISDLHFHMYMNAAKNVRSTYHREAGVGAQAEAESWGYIQILSADLEGADVTAELAYIQGEDAAPGDQTVMRLPLKSPLFPGQAVTLTFDFETKLPRHFARAGYEDDYVFAGQWFPKLGVWESAGVRGAENAGWNCRPYHFLTEFYADFGNYEVTIEVPAGYQVGATGAGQVQQGEERWTYRFRQDRVHDFAFVASPKLVRHTRTFQPDAVLAAAGQKPVDMILLARARPAFPVKKSFDHLEVAISYLASWLGPYPYPTLTMVDPLTQFSAGMEYPTLFTLVADPYKPDRERDLADVIIHEFAHQYWYGMVASNEFEEPWLDEGLTEYTTNRILDRQYGDKYGPVPKYMNLFRMSVPISDFLPLRLPTHTEKALIRAFHEKGREPVARPGWTYYSYGAYAANAYMKPASYLVQLEREIGEEAMNRVMRSYFQKWAYRHPCSADFMTVVNEVTGRDMSWFFAETFAKAGQLDYQAGHFFSYPLHEASGYQDTPQGPQLQNEPEAAGTVAVWCSVVNIYNHGNVHYPVDIQVTFEDGTQVTEHWNGDQAYKKFHYEKPAKVERVVVDPDGKLFLDVNQSNNSRTRTPDRTASKRWSLNLLLGLQHLLQAVAGGL